MDLVFPIVVLLVREAGNYRIPRLAVSRAVLMDMIPLMYVKKIPCEHTDVES